MKKVAAAVRAGHDLDDPAVSAALHRIEPLIRKRVDLINARRNAFVDAG